MKNFKKVLALVLAIATLLSFATVASAKTADFSDAADVQNVEALDVLSYIKVLEGYKADNSFKPAKNITREEAAKIIAIFANKSTDISSLYTSANPFADEKGRWGESYVAYGYRAGIIAGKNATTFAPKSNVKGTEFLKMVLVVLGYDQNKEGLVGSSWAVNTLELAKHKGLMDGLNDFEPNTALTRDEAAQIMLNALKAETVVYGQTVTNLVWNAANGYWTTTTATTAPAVYVSPNGAVNNYEHKLLAAGFGLTLTADTDAWGRPTHTWTKGAATIGSYIDSDKLVKTYNTSVAECQIAADAGLKKDTAYTVYVNGNKLASKETVQLTDTVGSFGSQGRLTEVYTDRIVMIDTFLAKVTDVTKVTYDAAGHKTNDATITLEVYTKTSAVKYIMAADSDYAYAVGDYVLLNAYTNTGSRAASDADAVSVATAVINRVATANVGVYGEIAGKATSVEGTQTVIYYNGGKHTVEGTTYDDACKFYLDEAGTKTTKHTWFFDSYGNLIGDVEIATVYTYGVITDLWYVNDGTNGSGKAMANVRYMDDTTNTVTVASIEGNAIAYGGYYGAEAMKVAGTTLYVASNAAINKTADQSNNDFIDGHLFKINTLADGTVAFEKVNHVEAGKVVHSELNKNISITNKYAYIIGNGSGIKIDATTKFMIVTPVDKDGKYDPNSSTYADYTYKTGMNELPTFAQVARVDYVLGADGAADYVYIIGELKDATSKTFVLVSGAAYSTPLKENGGIKYYEVTLPVPAEDGSVATLKIKNDAAGIALLNTLTSATNYGKLFYVTYTGEYATGAVEIDGIVKYEGETSKARAAKLTDAKMPYGVDAGVVVSGNAYFNVTEATKVIGDLSADMSSKVVYVIYTADDLVVSKIYVVDVNGSAIPNPTDPWVTTGNFSKNATTKQIKVLSDYATMADLVAAYPTATSVVATYYVNAGSTMQQVTLTGASVNTVASVLANTNATVVVTFTEKDANDNDVTVAYTVSK